MALLISYLLLALVVSFFCSITEAVLLSVRPAFVAALERRDARGAAALRKLKANLDRPLAAILSLNTVAHTVGAAGVGAQAAVVFGSEFVALTSAVLTLLILVLSEIIPKTLGANHWDRLAGPLAPVIVGLTKVLAPFVWLSEHVTRLVARAEASAFDFTRDELEAMAELGAEEGQIEPREYAIVSNLMRLDALSVRDAMTPRTVIFSVPADMTVRAFFDEHSAQPFSRIPVYRNDRDDITGYVLKTDLLLAQAQDQFDRRLEEFERPFVAIPDFVTVSQAFEQLIRDRAHIAVVVDEYGTVQGLLALEDVIEALIGLEITDETDTVESMRALARRRLRERAIALGLNPDDLEPQ